MNTKKTDYPVPIVFHNTRPEEPQVGDAWYDDFEYAPELIPEVYRHLRPLRVQVSVHHSFMVYSKSSSPPHNGWDVTGSAEAGDLTVAPSININAGYSDNWHGFITKGLIRLA